MRTKLHLPFNSDFSQGELVQEQLVFDHSGTRRSPFTAHTRVQKNRVPLIIGPKNFAQVLDNSLLKPYLAPGHRTWLSSDSHVVAAEDAFVRAERQERKEDISLEATDQEKQRLQEIVGQSATEEQQKLTKADFEELTRK